MNGLNFSIKRDSYVLSCVKVDGSGGGRGQDWKWKKRENLKTKLLKVLKTSSEENYTKTKHCKQINKAGRAILLVNKSQVEKYEMEEKELFYYHSSYKL